MLFSEEPKPKRSRAAVCASVALHVAVIVLLAWKPLPRYIKTHAVLHGMEGSGHSVVYLAYGGADNIPKSRDVDDADRLRLHLPKAAAKKPEPVPAASMASALTPTSNGSAGTLTGSLSYGYADGHEIRPAYPVVYPDPTVARAVCPAGVKGDVIVEVSIDEHGNIVQTRLLAGLGHGIDERVMAVLQNWRYNPATLDGSPIASQQDVHFHFPS